MTGRRQRADRLRCWHSPRCIQDMQTCKKCLSYSMVSCSRVAFNQCECNAALVLLLYACERDVYGQLVFAQSSRELRFDGMSS